MDLLHHDWARVGSVTSHESSDWLQSFTTAMSHPILLLHNYWCGICIFFYILLLQCVYMHGKTLIKATNR